MSETTQTVEQTSTNQEPLTEQELRTLKGRRANWYKDQLTYLKPEAEYHELLSRIEVAKANVYEAQLRQANVYAQMNPPKKEVDNSTTTSGEKEADVTTGPGNQPEPLLETINEQSEGEALV